MKRPAIYRKLSLQQKSNVVRLLEDYGMSI
jgi:hypothetical protein